MQLRTKVGCMTSYGYFAQPKLELPTCYADIWIQEFPKIKYRIQVVLIFVVKATIKVETANVRGPKRTGKIKS